MQAKLSTALIAKLVPREKPFEVVDTEVPGLRVRVQPNGAMLYYLRYTTRDGRRTAIPLGNIRELTLPQARDMAKDKLADVRKGADPVAELRAMRSTLTLGEFVEGDYAKTHLTTKRSGDATQARLATAFKKWWNTRLDHITPGMVEKWRAERRAAGKADATVNRDVTALKAVLNKAVHWDVLERNPLDKVKPLKLDTAAVVRYLTADEEKRLMAALDKREERVRAERDRANAWRRKRKYTELPDLRRLPFADCIKPLVLLSLHTGLRRGEAFSLEWDDIDFHHGQLTVRGDKAKSGRTRHVPLNSFIRQVLADWQKQTSTHGLVFRSEVTGERFDNCNTAWEAVLADAKIADFRWHDMRHHFASKLVMAGIDLNTVRDLLGHSNITMTLRYAHLAPEVKARAVEALVVPEGKIVEFRRRKGKT